MRDGRNTRQCIPGDIGIDDAGHSLFEVHSRVSAGNTPAGLLVADAVGDHVRVTDQGLTAGAAHVEARRGAVVDGASADGDAAAVDIDDTAAGTGGDFAMFQECRGAGMDLDGLIVREGWLDLYGGVAVPNIESVGIVANV